MKETTKSALRRSRDPAFITQYFRGNGVDIGAGDNPLSAHQRFFPLIKNVVPWDRPQGDAQTMPGIVAATFDFVHSSHCLEHMVDPAQALARWIEIVKPGGYIIITVPDEALYEKMQWPSRFNDDHKFSFTICEPTKRLPRSINVTELVTSLTHVAACERIQLVREYYDESQPNVDQTAIGEAECAIEIVLRRR